MFNTYVCNNRVGQPTWGLRDAVVQDITQTLNLPDSATFTVPQKGANVRYIDGIRREIQIREEIEGGLSEVAFQGTVANETGDKNTARFTCAGIDSLLSRRIVDRASLLFESVDQFYIASELVRLAQDQTFQGNRDFNIDFATVTGSGKIRSRKYNRTEHSDFLKLLSEFPTLKDGFDYRLEITPDGGRFFTPYFPKKGSFKPNLGLQFTEDGSRNITNFNYTRDWTKLATQVYCTGGSEGDVKFEENYEDVQSSAYWGAVLQSVISDGSQKDVAWLLDKATQTVLDRKQPIFQPTITTARAPRDYWRLVQVGDTIPVWIDWGRVLVVVSKRVAQKKLTIKGDIVDLTFESDDTASV